MNAFYGARAGWNGYASSPYSGTAQYADYASRLALYTLYEAYRANTVYDDLRFIADALTRNKKFYRGTVGLHNPVKRLVDLYAGNVYNGTLNYADLGEGALPLAYDNAALTDPLQQVLKWSNLGQQLSRYTGDCATLGDYFWWVVDDPFRQRARLELLHPSKVRDMNTDEVGNIKALVIEYARSEDADIEQYQPRRNGSGTAKTPKSYTYTMKVTREDSGVRFQTYKDGELYPFQQDADGQPMAEWMSDYPFIPAKHAGFEPTDIVWARNAFYASREKIDQVNSVASQLNQSIRRVIEPILLAKNVNTETGADGQKRLAFSTQRDDGTGVSVLFVNGTEVDITPLNIPLDIGQATAHIQNLLSEIEHDMPVLALQRIRDSGAVSGTAVRNMYGDAEARIQNARMNLDTPLAQALQMAVTIGGIRGYSGFEAFSADSYDNGDMELRVKERPVFPDELTTQERIQGYVSVAGLPPAWQRVALQDMNVSADEIDAMVTETDAQAQQQPADGATGTPERMARVADILQRAGVSEAAGVQGATV